MRILITGGAGFIGANAVRRFHAAGWDVAIIDDLSRRGSKFNLEWLAALGVPHDLHRIDISDAAAVMRHFSACHYDAVLHLAAQVAVTTSVTDPRRDFEINAQGTFNLLEAVRLHNPEAVFINASTNKVYGKLASVRVVEETERYVFADGYPGVAENAPLDFYSPYGCSKGIADQYSLDYHRIYGLRTVSLRQSCIYGERQFGIEDQGWVAWFIIAHLTGKPLTIYGNGKQVRDLLHVDDLIDAYFAVIDRIDGVAGRAFNIGGGGDNTLSLLEFVRELNRLSAAPLQYAVADWRPGDQPLYSSDITAAREVLGWSPKTMVRDGIRALYNWVGENRTLFKD